MAIVQEYNFKIKLEYGLNVEVQSCFHDSQLIVLTDLMDNFGGGAYGHVWAIARAIVQSGIDWLDWDIYHMRIMGRYRELLNGASEYRNCSYNSEVEHKKIMWDRYELACKLYALDYVPEGVRMPAFVEGIGYRLSDFRRYAEEIGLSNDALDNYFLRSFDSDRIFLLENSSFEDESKEELIYKGVVRTGKEINRSVMASCLNFVESRTILKELGIKPDKSLGKCRNQVIYALEDNMPSIEVLIMSARDWSLYGEILAIPGYEWDDFQSYRQQIKGAATALVDIYDKIVSPDLSRKLS
jgi:hypothetical protein